MTSRCSRDIWVMHLRGCAFRSVPRTRLFGSVGSVRDNFRGGLIKLGIAASAECRESFDTRDRQDPCRNLRSVFESAGLPSHAQGAFADEIEHELGDEAVSVNMVPPIQRAHCGVAAVRNRLDEVFADWVKTDRGY
jgi:hypothetical protein